MMSEENNELNQKNDKKEPSFIRQTIKGRPVSKKGLLVTFITICVFTALAAVIGAFIFVNMIPVAEKISGKVTPTPRITIPPFDIDELPTASPTQTPTPTVTPMPTASVTPVLTQAPDAQDKNPGDVKPKDLTIDQYIKLQDQLMKIADKASKSMVRVTAISSQMDYFNQSVENRQQISGVLIAQTEDSYFVLTESRVFNNIERIQVTFANGYIADAIYQKEDPDTGLVVLKVNAADLDKETIAVIHTASLGNSYLVSVGDLVIALGAPNGYTNSISFGRITSMDSIISAIDCEYNLITTDIIGTANGNGVLIDVSGTIVGFINQSYGMSDSPVVTGISISQLKSLIEHLSNGESRPYIGIRASEVTSSVSEITGIPKGILITKVADESPAFFVGLSELDVITQLNEDRIANMSQYKASLSKLSPGDEAKLVVLRKGAEGYTEIEFTIKTGEI